VKKLLSFFVLFLLFVPEVFASDGVASVNPLTMIPFAFLLLSIAIIPQLNEHWWKKNYTNLSIGLGLMMVCFYAFFLGDVSSLKHAGIDYIGFMIMVVSFFVVASCISVKIDCKPTPLINTTILFVGALLSNAFSTTGATILLIRSFLAINKDQDKEYRLAFFIFIVCNTGGLLTPQGQPTLFLGFLKGVPFSWPAENLWQIWLVINSLLLFIFYVIDKKNYVDNNKIYSNTVEIDGKQNFLWLGGLVSAILFLNTPTREITMVVIPIIVYFSTKKEFLIKNKFSFEPVKEVGILFFGIFACMIPALQWMTANASSLGIKTPGEFYFYSGLLSAVLDNGPTYLNFLALSSGDNGINLATEMPKYIALFGVILVAISAGSSCFGALTYIGNGPNLIAKAIAEELGIKTPNFMKFVYMYSAPALMPVFILVWYVFLT
jgi:Na+/H+ antiporter NhaD/arsenite permease-like protein